VVAELTQPATLVEELTQPATLVAELTQPATTLKLSPMHFNVERNFFPHIMILTPAS